jgi:sugar lactone lactonase YvrE
VTTKTRWEVAVRMPALLGEGSYWDIQRQLLYWLDIEGRRLYVYDPDTGLNTSHELGSKAGTVVAKKAGGLIVALENSISEFDPETGDLTERLPFEVSLTENRANDGKCDPMGRLWVGSMAPEDRPGEANLYRIGTDYSITKVLSDLTISNGIVWTRDGSTMYYIDTPTREIWRFDYDLDTGEISNKTVAIVVPEGMGFPDGMTIDSEDRLWVAHFGGWGVRQWDPETAEMLDYIELPVKNVTSCAFGDADLRTLYVTTARILNSEEELESQPLAGCLFRVRSDVAGVKANYFG